MKKRLTSLLLAVMLVLALLPVQPALAAELPQDEFVVDMDGEETPENVPKEPDGDDSAGMPALGSNGVEYSDVVYLSVAAYNSMDADAQAAYMQTMDEVTALIEAGVEISDVVFSLNEDGVLGFTCLIPMEVLDTGLDIELPEYNGESDPAETPDGEESKTPIAENVELADSVAIPVETFESVPLEDSMAILSGVIEDGDDLAELDTLFWTNKNWFYNQLSTYAKDYYNAGYKTLVQGTAGTNIFTTASKGFSIVYVADGLSALINTYPQKFDWRGATRDSNGRLFSGISCSYSYSSGTYTVRTTMSKSPHYSASLESQAQSKVKSLVTNAYNYAKKSYPNSITYGIVRYFDEWLCANNYYNMTGTYEDAQETSTYYFCHNSYGALLKGYAVCESYALAMSRLLDAAGIPNLYVVGDAGGGHAWNYVQMPNTYWYLQDTTWNDTTSPSHNYSSRTYLLCRNDTRHTPTGKAYVSGNTFSYPARSSSSYSPSTTETFKLNKTSLTLAKGKSETLSLTTTYYDSYVKTWSSSNTKVATVDQKGKVTAVGSGTATITLTIGGKSLTCKVTVGGGGGGGSNKVTGLTFNNGGKSSLKADNTFKAQSFTLTAATTTGNTNDLANSSLSVKSSKDTVATATVSRSGKTITLKVTPKGVGSASIKVTFGGKTATLSLKVTRELQSGWFKLESTSMGYTGSALKPKVQLTSSAPKDVKYKVKYINNKDYGTATVEITGSGGYSNTVKKTFAITTVAVNSSTTTVTAPKAATYNGKPIPAKVTVKVNVNGKNKTLKAGKDYEILYNNSATVPTNAGTYTLMIKGIGNYKGSYTVPSKYIINKAPITKMSASLSSSIKSTGSPVNPTALNLKVKIGSVVLTSGYKISYRNSDGAAISAPSAPGKYTIVITPTSGNFAATAKNPGVLEITKTFTIK